MKNIAIGLLLSATSARGPHRAPRGPDIWSATVICVRMTEPIGSVPRSGIAVGLLALGLLRRAAEGRSLKRRAMAIILFVGHFRRGLIRRRGRALLGIAYSLTIAQARLRCRTASKEMGLPLARNYCTVGIVYDGLPGRERGVTLRQLNNKS